MKQVKSFETKDGKLFTDRIAAEGHELMLNTRGLIQTKIKTQSTFTTTQVAEFIRDNQEEVFQTLQKYRRTMAGIKSNLNR